MQITIIIPTYNEAENLPKLVSALLSLPLKLKILVVDDHSPDGTGEIADSLSQKYPDNVEVIHRAGKLGLRTAYINGIQYALANGADAIGQMDADFSHDPERLVEMAKMLETRDVVLGSRYVPGGRVDARWPIWRKWLSAFGNFYARTILGFDLRDVTTGYRLWRRETLKGMPLERIQSNGYVFLVEMVYIAHRLGYRFGEVPIYFADRQFGTSKMSLKIQLEAALRIWAVRWSYRDLHKYGMQARVKR